MFPIESGAVHLRWFTVLSQKRTVCKNSAIAPLMLMSHNLPPENNRICHRCGQEIPQFELSAQERDRITYLMNQSRYMMAMAELRNAVGCSSTAAKLWIDHRGRPNPVILGHPALSAVACCAPPAPNNVPTATNPGTGKLPPKSRSRCLLYRYKIAFRPVWLNLPSRPRHRLNHYR